MAERIEVYLGKDTEGNHVKIDLTRAPHVLLGGCSGSGKTNMLHSFLTKIGSMSPKRINYFIGDPKRVEFMDYVHAPQVRMIANTAAEHDHMLSELCDIMEERYEWMKSRSIKNVVDASFLANILVVIDEFGDLVLHPVLGKRITMSLTRLVQLGRSAGINCIIATQHPTVKTVNTTIKANCPTRICMRVSSAVNSRVIIDRPGGESLRGNGHCLLMSPYINDLKEIQTTLFDERLVRLHIRAACTKYANLKPIAASASQ